MSDVEREYWSQYETPRDGESSDGSGGIRPVPAGVPNVPEEGDA